MSRRLLAGLFAFALANTSHSEDNAAFDEAYANCMTTSVPIERLVGTPRSVIERRCRETAQREAAWASEGELTVHVDKYRCSHKDNNGSAATDCVPDSLGGAGVVKVTATLDANAKLVQDVLDRLQAIGVGRALLRSLKVYSKG